MSSFGVFCNSGTQAKKKLKQTITKNERLLKRTITGKSRDSKNKFKRNQ